MKKRKAISLFCGAGGCSLGFKMSGYDIVYATDIDKKAIETYQTNFPETLAENRDIKDIDFKHLLKKLNLQQGELDFLIGGPPCQGFSTAGTRFWDDPRNSLLKEYVRCLNEIKPKWFLMENVEGLLTTKNGDYIYEASKAFIDLGYKIRIDKIYSHEYGVPQRRKRVFIIGNSLGIDFDIPKPIYPLTGKIFKNSKVTLDKALVNLPKATHFKDEILKYDLDLKTEKIFDYYKNPKGLITDHYSPELSKIQLERVQHLNQGQSMRDLPAELQHDSFKKRANRRVMDGVPSEKRGGAPSGIKRLFNNQPSLTITSAATREFIHPNEDRMLTIRESARIQTFPDEFIFCGSQSQKIQQIGNAIPPILAQVFGTYILNNFSFEKTENEYDGKLLSFSLSKASAMSPALKKTSNKLTKIKQGSFAKQLDLF